MNPSKTQILGTTLLLYFVLLLAGTLFKIMHLPYAEVILGMMFICGIIFTALAVFEIIQSSRINMNEKIMWVIGLLFLGLIGSALYWFSGRKRILASVA
jgi:xanthine/uracil/vitamin C permease (AzgA family)